MALIGATRVLGDGVVPATEDVGDEVEQYAIAAASLGSTSRTAEIEAAGHPVVRDDLSDMLLTARERQTFSDTWLGTIVGVAAVLAAAGHKSALGDGDDEGPLGDGFGPEAQRDLGAIVVLGALLLDSESGARRDVGLSVPVLHACWLYGYYLGACAASLPPSAHAALGP